MSNKELCLMSATETAAAIRERKVSPAEVVDAVLERIDELNPRLNAFCTLTADEARSKARAAEEAVVQGSELGPLHGVPVSIKDLVFTKGVRTTGGSKIFEHYVPDQDAVVVEKLKQAGAIILGKTNTPEFGHKGVTNNPVFGATYNPWAEDCTPGGSSGGAGAAVAAGMGPLAVGTDGGGSIRIPASFSGVYGLKPHFGRVAKGAGFPSGMPAFSHTGPLTRNVRDAALMLDAMAGPDEGDRTSLPATDVSFLDSCEGGIRGLRVAYSPDFGYAAVDPVVRSITARAARVFADLGCELVEEDPGFNDPESIFMTIVKADFHGAWGEKLNEWKDKIDPTLRGMLEDAGDVTAMDYVKACQQREVFWGQVNAFFQRYDLLLCPATAVPPFSAELSTVTEIEGRELDPLGWVSMTFPFNLTGQPAASIPCGWTGEGLPIGLQIVGRRFDEATILRASAAFEEASPWSHRYETIG
jgi:aspartyl-tRNA(Asn)/glutamyl-tRNA(Gln) amidotransferase subunit A